MIFIIVFDIIISMKTSTDKVVLPSEIFYSSYVFASGKPLLAKLRLKIDKEGFEKVKPPFLLLVNHSSKDNIKIAAAVMFPQKFNFIVNPEDVSSNSVITGYMGVIPLKRNVFDDETIGKIQKVVAANGSVALFAEQKVSVDGTPTYINPSVAKLIKTLRIPVCVLTINGSYLNRPSFSQKTIGCSGATAVLSNLFTSDEIKYMSEEEVLHAVAEATSYDEFEFQRERKIILSNKNTAEGLENILFRCPRCQSEFTLKTAKDTVSCTNCGTKWVMGRYGVLMEDNGTTSIPSVPAWNYMQRRLVRNEVENDEYDLSGNCKLVIGTDEGYHNAGNGRFTHKSQSFVYEGSMDGKTVRLTFRNAEHFNLQFMPGEYIEFMSDKNCYRFISDKPELLAKVNLAIEEAISLAEEEEAEEET